jgi:uncharacterized protein YbaR (Trm112 family)
VGGNGEPHAPSLRSRGEPINPQLLEILACPLDADRPPLVLRDDLLVCKKCGYGFRIIDGIPDLLPEHAISPEDFEVKANG